MGRNTLFNKNLRQLKKAYPRLYNKIMMARDPEEHRVETAKNGLPTLLVHSGENLVSVHSTYDPAAEASRWAQMLGNDWDVLVLFGCGLGYHLQAVRKAYPQKKIILVERDYRFLLFPNRYLDLTAVWGANIAVVVTADPKDAGQAVSRLLMTNLAHRPLFKALPAYEHIYREYWTTFQDAISDTYINLSVNFATRDHFRTRWYLNIRDNLPAYLEAPGINTLYGKFEGVPVIIVASGPSLEKNIHLLPQFQGRALIIAAGSGMLALQKEKILPDLLFSYDPGENNYTYIFKQIADDSAPLVFASSIFSRIPREYRGLKFSFSLDIAGNWFETAAGLEKGSLPSGATIVVSCLELAAKMGGNPIVLVGQDLGYSAEKSHADGVGYSKSMGEVKKKLFAAEGIGGTVYTDEVYWTMKLQIEDRIKNLPGKTFIDATEGGLLINGAAIRPLREVLALYGRQKHPIGEIIAEAGQKRTPLNGTAGDRLFAALQKLQQERMEIKNLYQKALEGARAITGRAEKSGSSPDKILKEIESCWLKIENMEMFQHFIRHMMIDQLQITWAHFNKQISGAEESEQRLHTAATGYATMFHQVLQSATYLEQEFFSLLEKQFAPHRPGQAH